MPVNWVEVDPDMSDHILLGTDYGLYTSLNAGQSWQKEDRFPNAPIDQIRLRHSDRKLYIYTHGRGIWTANLKNNLVASVKKTPTISLKIYPNPATDYIHLETKADLIKVYNSSGQEIISTSNKTIATATWPSGTYFVEVKRNGSASVKKVVVTH